MLTPFYISKTTSLALGILIGAALMGGTERTLADDSITWESLPAQMVGADDSLVSALPSLEPAIAQDEPIDQNAVISPAAFRAARAAMARLEQAEANASSPTRQTSDLPSFGPNAATSIPVELSPTSGDSGYQSTPIAPATSQLSQTTFDSPATRRGPDLMPVPATGNSQRLTSVATDGANDFPMADTATNESNDSAQPFRFASAQQPAKRPSLPSLPGEQSSAGSSKTPTSKAAGSKKTFPGVLANANSFVLAEQPQLGDHWKDNTPIVDPRAWHSETYESDFSPDMIDPHQPVDAWAEMQIYEGKTLNANQRPLVELGRPWYQLGQLSPGSSVFGHHNIVTPQFLVFGDVRTAVASNNLGNNSTTLATVEANLDFDLKLTGTERLHMFMSPFDEGGRNTGYLFDEDRFQNEYDAKIDFGYLEGDLGAIVGGAIGKTLPFDLPFAVGVIPLLLQNGVWMEDAFLGVAATIPARNSPRFDISNMDITFFAGYDKIDSPAFAGDESAAKMYGMASFIEANNGYWEIDYAFLEDRTGGDLSYHNIGVGFTRRYGRLISNSTRVIANAGQEPAVGDTTADGVLLLSENSLITGAPSSVVPYANFFAGFGRPQSAARAGVAGGVLRNTGILFESDGMTGYPTLDDTANDTFGMALGLNLLPNDFSQQLVVETALLGAMGSGAGRNARGDQYGIGVRYQLPLTNAIIFRTDAMVGFRRGDEDINGFRMELRHKF